MKLYSDKYRIISFSIFLLLVFLITSENYRIMAQDDEARQESGLPIMIGSRPGTIRGAGASLAGSLLIQGINDDTSLPTFTVSVYVNGRLFSRQRVKNRGSFNFTGIPERGISLVVEADNLEIANYPVNQLLPPPSSNRQDIFLVWSQITPKIQSQTGVISLKNIYTRSEENQKLFNKALSNAKDKKNDEAIKLLKQILETDENDFVVWTELGNAYFTKGSSSEAEKSYNKAITLKADFLPALINLGKLYLNEKNFDLAIEVFNKALAVSPTSADANHYLGESYLQIKKGSKAVVYLNEAIRLAPIDKAEIHLRLATLYNAAGAKERAVAEYKLFLEKVPNYPDKAKIEKYITENSSK